MLKNSASANADKKRLRKELKISEDEILIGMTGRFSPGKGHEEFLFAANQLGKRFSNLKFIVVGEASRGEEEYAVSIKQLSKTYDLKNIYFIGFRTDVPDVLAAMDIFVFPSHAEAFGIALIEAMAMEKPSVCSDADGVPDIAVENETSYMFSVRNGNDLTEKLEQLIINKVQRKLLGINARKRVMDKFDLKIITDQTINAYSKIIEEQK